MARGDVGLSEDRNNPPTVMLVELASDYLVSTLAREVLAYVIHRMLDPEWDRGSLRPVTRTTRSTTVLSDTTGRVRLQLTGLRRNPARARTVEGVLGALPGVGSAQASAVTGSVLVLYAPQRITVDCIRSALDPRPALAHRRLLSRAVQRDRPGWLPPVRESRRSGSW